MIGQDTYGQSDTGIKGDLNQRKIIYELRRRQKLLNIRSVK